MACELPDTARTSLAPRSTERHVSEVQEADLVASERRNRGRHLKAYDINSIRVLPFSHWLIKGKGSAPHFQVIMEGTKDPSSMLLRGRMYCRGAAPFFRPISLSKEHQYCFMGESSVLRVYHCVATSKSGANGKADQKLLSAPEEIEMRQEMEATSKFGSMRQCS